MLETLRRRFVDIAYLNFPWLIYSRLPTIVTVEPTNVCTLKCPTCPTPEVMERKKGMMPFDTFKVLADQIYWKLGRFNFSWSGEPLMNRQLLKMVGYAWQRGIPAKIDTNGMFLQGRIDEIFEAHLAKINVALNGLTQETLAKYRVNADFDTVFSALAALCKKKIELGVDYPEIHLQFLVMRHNEHEISRVIEVGKEIGVDVVDFKTMAATVWWLSPEENQKLMDEYLPTNPRFLRYEKKNGRWVFKSGLDKACPDVRNGVIIMWNGDVVICCQDWEGKHAIGNILKEPLADIWHKKVAMETRVKGLKRSLDICNGCVTTSARIENVRFNHK